MDDVTPVKFLIVDDDIVDIMAIKRNMKKLKLANPVIVAKDGKEALEILRGDAKAEQIAPPYLMTLDLNMPRMGGRELLDIMRQDPLLKNVVVFIWSTSDAQEDIDAAYAQNVAGYIVKQHGAEAFQRALNMLDQYQTVVVLPK